MNLRQIEILRAFMLTGTVSGAADLLRVSQPGVSKSLKSIEDRLEVQLFRRVKGRLAPTAEAEQLFAAISDAWGHIERVAHLARNLGTDAPATLRVGTTPSLGATLISSVMALLTRRNKNLRLSVELSAPAVLVESLFVRNIDVAVTLFPISHPALITEKVADSPLVCVMPKNHPLSNREWVTPGDISRYPLISYPPETSEGHLLDDLFERAGLARKVVIEVRSSASACWLVKAGAGVTVVDYFTIYGEPFPGVVARPVQPGLSFDVCICTHALAPVSNTLVSFTREVRRECRLAERRRAHAIPR